MNNNKKAQIRHNQIRDMLLKKDIIDVHEFCDTLHASQATIRNDLAYLENLNYLKRVLGGAVSTEGTPRNTTFHSRISIFKQEKEEIASYVVKNYIKKGMIIALDAGTTCLAIAQKLMEEDISCEVITYSFAVANMLSKTNHISIYLAGGKLDYKHYSFHDELTLACIEKLHCDLFFLSPNGIDINAQITSAATQENIIKTTLMKQANQTVVVCDHSKFNKTALKVLCKLNEVEAIVTDQNIDKDILQHFNKNYPIIIANNR
ncbi:MAG: DeoR/GlpR family DNA-binding transcription regulator [Erysipelotrichaceae bacterium]